MKVSSRDELMDVIDKYGVETYPVKSKANTKLVNTILYDKYKDKFYRIKWGEVPDDNNTYHIWYDKFIEEVFLNQSPWKQGWFSKEEIKQIDIDERKRKEGIDLKEFEFRNVEKNVITSDLLDGKAYDNLEFIGGKAGSGKTWAALRRVVKAIKEDKSVLLFSTECQPKELTDRLLCVLTEIPPRQLNDSSNDKKLELAKSILEKSKLTIDTNSLIDDNYIIAKMKKKSANEGLDFVMIDHLILVSNDEDLNNYDNIVNIHKRLESITQELNCCMTIVTQLSSNCSTESSICN